MPETPPPLRIGILGAAAIAPAAIVRPARATPGVEVTAIAARDPARAHAFAAKHGIPKVADSYEALLGDPDIDAVYIPLPNGLHGAFTRRAVAAGKHVLCEKPFTANAAEAREVTTAVAVSGRVVMEAFHWRYHPIVQRLLDIVASGEIGEVRHLDAGFCFPLLKRNDIRWSRSLAGGALLDAGCYPVHQLRTLGGLIAGVEPMVIDAQASVTPGGVDRMLEGSLRFIDGPTATMRCGFLHPRRPVDLHLRVTGSDGEVLAFNPVLPHVGGHLRVQAHHRRRQEWADRTPSYTYQLRAFVDAVRDGTPFPTTAADAVNTMQVLDDLQRAAGLEPPEPTPTAPEHAP